MNEGLIISFSLIPVMLIIRLYYSGTIAFFQNMLSISILILISLCMLFAYENSLNESITEDTLEKVADTTIQAVDWNSFIYRPKHEPLRKEPTFEQDKESEKKNKRIVDKTLIVGVCTFFPLLFILYYIDPYFVKNFILNLLSVIILTIIQVFFTFSIRENYKDQDLKSIRYLILCEISNIKCIKALNECRTCHGNYEDIGFDIGNL